MIKFQEREQPSIQTFEFGGRSRVDSAPNSWPVSRSASESSAKAGSAYIRPWETQWQPKKAAFSVGCPTHEVRRGCEQRETKAAKGSSAYMEQMSPKLEQKNASFSAGIEPQWQPKNAAFSVGSNKEHKKGINQLDKGTSSGFDEECKEFVRMFREKLQEFVMILIKKYHYNFPVEYFDNYHCSFNKNEFLKMEQPKEKFRRQEVDSLPTSNTEWKKYVGLGGMGKKGDDNDNAGSNSRPCGGSVQGVWAKGELKEHTDSFGKEVLDGDVFGILQQEQSNFKEEGEEEKSEEKGLEDYTQSIDSLSSTLTSAETLGQVSVIEQSLAGSEVAAAPNVNAHKQPWYEYSRKEYKPPLLHFEAVVDISIAKHGCGLNGDRVIAPMAEDLPFLLVLDGNEVFLIEILGQFILGIDLENLRMKKKRPRSRKKERRIIRIEKVGIG